MLALTILSIIVVIIVLIIYMEYRNEKKYQEKRRQQRQTPTPTKQSIPTEEPKKVAPEPKPEIKPEPEVKLEPKPEPKIEVPKEVKETKELPQANYPNFTHVRLVEMGLSADEAKEFVFELIPQIEEQILRMEEAIDIPDFNEMERLTHEIKGSATNLGTGGVSDLLVEYNTYLKTGTDTDIARAYLKLLKHYTNELKVQYN